MSIKLKKIKNDKFSLSKNEDLEYLIGLSYGIHHKMLHIYNNFQLTQASSSYKNSALFDEILTKISDFEQLEVEVTKKEIVLISKWIDSICQLLYEEYEESDKITIINIDKPRLMKYWKVAGEFLKKSRKITGDQ
jgi:hypothetical protein